MKITKFKLIFTGSKITIQEFERPFGYDFESKANKNSRPRTEKLLDPEECARKARNRLKKLIWSNGWQITNPQTNKPYKPIFITLTFADNIQDLKTANLILKNFIKRLNHYVSKN